jgi:hypothetical protein
VWEASDNDAQDAAAAESLPAEGGLDDQPVLNQAEGRNAMLTVDAIATLVPSGSLTDDELTDLIAAVVDYLDDRVIDPSISTIRGETGVRVEVSVTIDTDDLWHAHALAAAVMRDAFESAVPAVAGMTQGLVLQAA